MVSTSNFFKHFLYILNFFLLKRPVKVQTAILDVNEKNEKNRIADTQNERMFGFSGLKLMYLSGSTVETIYVLVTNPEDNG